MKYNPNSVYKRIDNILYQDDVAIVKFTFSRFCDFNPLSKEGVNYMQRYMDMHQDKGYFYFLNEVILPLDRSSSYKRINNILYKDNIAIVQLHSTFKDIEELTKEEVIYMERFIHENEQWREILADCIVVDDPLQEIQVDQKSYATFIAADLKQSPPNTVGGRIHESQLSNQEETPRPESIYEVKLNVEQISSDPTLSRLDQVRACMEGGETSPSAIAKKIGANASYVQRLVSQIKKEKANDLL